MQMATKMGAVIETAYSTIRCKCGAGPFVDRETWVRHVREGVPPRQQRKRRDYRAEEAEQKELEEYIGSHGIVEILSARRRY